MKFYLDGKEVSPEEYHLAVPIQGEHTYIISSDSESFQITISNESKTKYFKGIVNNMVKWGRKLKKEEIEEKYKKTL
jgi:hypothetical protein